MYSRYQNYRFGRAVSVPSDYSGNAFAEPSAEEESSPQEIMYERDEPQELPSLLTDDEGESEQAEESTPASLSADIPTAAQKKRKAIDLPFKFNIGKLFSGGIGSEELLILALIFLISQNDTDNELLLLLALLLFVG